MKEHKKLPSAVIKRMPRYYRYLTTLQQMGISRISSRDLGNRMGVTASQVRHDFFSFGASGLQGYGYDVDLLRQEIRDIFGLDDLFSVIIIGAGNLGHALAKYSGFEKNGYKIAAIFDVKPEIIGERINDIEIIHLDKLQEYVQDNHVDIAALTVPEIRVLEVAKLVTDNGIKALWNFSPIELLASDDIVVENIQMIDSLMVLGYNLRTAEAKLNPN
ncbi:Redox-sensing transcriptional repressor rex [Syntrophobotulus glycolicus DSM 8271]|uniref:Redox-sensing transcriptional repressor Rex n=1 Tax=Syntrophobotulus glycolicus (strain DSM 8271 / FlGlyR) TaxID=645991 RepID=F0T0R0_SYNGF|nr:redox-sensing transcriptional repressor Rex [Syntrophobotulus glycolicus]ADY56199.1 Redox-sensing transcriptional repressor rex [Syntrophobotulus glycolicus DSM 8271]